MSKKFPERLLGQLFKKCSWHSTKQIPKAGDLILPVSYFCAGVVVILAVLIHKMHGLVSLEKGIGQSGPPPLPGVCLLGQIGQGALPTISTSRGGYSHKWRLSLLQSPRQKLGCFKKCCNVWETRQRCENALQPPLQLKTSRNVEGAGNMAREWWGFAHFSIWAEGVIKIQLSWWTFIPKSVSALAPATGYSGGGLGKVKGRWIWRSHKIFHTVFLWLYSNKKK